MEKLTYVIEDKTIVQLLGVQNFSTKESAILELVKNAYDAQAKNLSLTFSTSNGISSLVIVDDGIGMNEEDVRTKWMHVGKSDKGYFINEDKSERIYAGAKGIGRFALSRLGASAKLISKKQGFDRIYWISNWENNWLDSQKSDSQAGTMIILNELTDRWTSTSIRDLSNYLSLVYNDSLMSIKINSGEESYVINPGWLNPDFGDNCVSYIDLKYSSSSRTLLCHISSDEFLPLVSEIVSPINTEDHIAKLNVFDAFNKADMEEEERRRLNDELENLGDFTARFYFSLDGRSLRADDNPYQYKYLYIPNRINQGIVLYRNAFSISSYEGKKDWLNLSSRATASPAAASHPTGGWRVRKNQLSGYVNIDKVANAELKDLSSRQGLNENTYYSLFVRILEKGINEFERYRQSIIRILANLAEQEDATEAETLIDTLKKNPEKIKDLDDDDVGKLLSEIKVIEDSKTTSEQKRLEHEERYRYDVRLLNTLATIGLKAGSIAHELQNKRNFISTNYRNIVRSLTEYGFWDDLNKPEFTRISTKNVPRLLLENNTVSKQLLVFLDTMLTGIQKNYFFPETLDLNNEINEIARIWASDYPWLTITTSDNGSETCRLPKDALNVVLDNLILNSIQQNNTADNLKINIEFTCISGLISIDYSDSGIGLCAAYKDDPYLILEPHESSREEGHGLGMWIINNTVEMHDGEILDIPTSQEGFKILLSINESTE